MARAKFLHHTELFPGCKKQANTPVSPIGHSRHHLNQSFDDPSIENIWIVSFRSSRDNEHHEDQNDGRVLTKEGIENNENSGPVEFNHNFDSTDSNISK